jgi:hypothetical protein
MTMAVGLTGLQILDYKGSDCKSNPAEEKGFVHVQTVLRDELQTQNS